MKTLQSFAKAFAYAHDNGLVVCIDYGDFYNPDGWDFITIIPGITKFCVTKMGITINNKYIPWNICSAFCCCPMIAENHIGLSVKTYDNYETKN